MHPLVLYLEKTYVSPYAMSVYVALKEKEIDFTIHTIDLEKEENRQDFYIAVCPTEKIPCLELATGEFLFESMAITEFLEDYYNDSNRCHLYPKNIIDKAKCRSVQSLVKSDFLTIKKEMPSTTVFGIDKPNFKHSDELEREIQKLIRVAQSTIQHEWLTEVWSIADFDLAFMLNRLAKNGIPLDQKLSDYIEKNWSLSSVQSWLTLQKTAH
ncbi:glutathione transferase [Pelistega europaea]|uniref:Glutathione transferase n=1 Tax=Pelistega europaea TaxID=106147 RepID=A0A7Y4L830_9BURK|nr:glutathione transferase [Pelistega europaea]NOL48709.1 glutathione transferase [Pelistega europaea]